VKWKGKNCNCAILIILSMSLSEGNFKEEMKKVDMKF
jgi:hypothetical protein